MATSKHRTFVLVHGAWHGGWCWRRVADVLSARGHRVFAPSLTGLGDRAHLFTPDISLQTDLGTFTFKRSGSNGLKRTYIATTCPPYAMLVPTHDRIRADKTWSFAAIETGHDAMVTAPDELASMLADA